MQAIAGEIDPQQADALRAQHLLDLPGAFY